MANWKVQSKLNCHSSGIVHPNLQQEGARSWVEYHLCDHPTWLAISSLDAPRRLSRIAIRPIPPLNPWIVSLVYRLNNFINVTSLAWAAEVNGLTEKTLTPSQAAMLVFAQCTTKLKMLDWGDGESLGWDWPGSSSAYGVPVSLTSKWNFCHPDSTPLLIKYRIASASPSEAIGRHLW
jgi:hypothetical protein